MRFAHITPIPLLNAVLSDDNTFHLCISDLVLDNPVYTAFYRNRKARGDYIIMDSPAFETGLPADLKDTLHAEGLLQPHEVVLPDDLTSADNTIKLSTDTRNALLRAGYNGMFMAVPHGRTLEEYINCTKELLEGCSSPLRGMPVIGIQEEIPELYGISRNEMMQRLRLEYAQHSTRHVQFHLLGIGEKLEELTDPDVRCLARSSDTAKFVVYGLNGISVSPWSASQTLPAYPGRDSVGGRTGYFHYRTDSAVAITTARLNATNWNEFEV